MIPQKFAKQINSFKARKGLEKNTEESSIIGKSVSVLDDNCHYCSGTILTYEDEGMYRSYEVEYTPRGEFEKRVRTFYKNQVIFND